jgi:tetratricopeptide (TPR) repeat protein
MSTPSLPKEGKAKPYESLVEIRAAYNNLARAYRKSLGSEPSEDLLNEAGEFIERGRKTGTILDDPEERSEAQNMLNFWANILYRYRRVPSEEPPDVTLSDFGSPELPNAKVGPVPFQAPPLPRDIYVGREDFLSDLRQQLFAGRNIALCSSPGTGKTLIATKLAHDPKLRKRFSDGILWAKLGDEPDVSNILRCWGEALNIVPKDGDEQDWFMNREYAAKVIRQALGRRQMLLIIDDAWQSDVAMALKLGGQKCAHIVTTYLMSVALDFDPQGAVTVPNLSPADGMRILFRKVPKAVKGQQRAAAQLVDALGNSPFALSLLANYCRLESNGVAANLEELSYHLLQSKEAIEAERSPAFPKTSLNEVQTPSSLLASIGWCFNQIKEHEKYVLQALAFFPPKPNSFSDAAARYITEEHSKGIERLLDYGLLERTSSDRYCLHRAVSDFLKYQPRELTDPTPEQRMASFYVDLVKRTVADRKGFQVLEEEEKNILAALEIAYKREMWELVVEGTNALFGYFDRRGLYAVARENLNRARHAAQKLHDEHSLAAILLELGEMGERQSECAEASEYLQASLDIAKSLQKHDVSARALQGLGVVAMAQANYDDAKRHLNEALGLAHEIGDTHLECTIETRLGWLDRVFGNFEQCKERTDLALSLARAHNYHRQIAELELSLGVLYFLKKNYEKAKKHDLEGLRYAQETRDKRLQCALHQALGGVEIELQNFEEAEMHLMKSLHLSIEIGHRWYKGVIWKELGELRLKQNLPNSAADAFKKGLDLAREVNSPELMAMSIYGLARVAAVQENFAEARLHGQTSLNIFKSMNHYKIAEVMDWLHSVPRTL